LRIAPIFYLQLKFYQHSGTVPSCFPYCAWQKGTNENLNGLLREFYPKGRNLSRGSPQTLKKNLARINAWPKKVLGFKKPVDLFDLFLSQCCT